MSGPKGPLTALEPALKPEIFEKLEQNPVLRQKLGEDYKIILREIVREIEIVSNSGGPPSDGGFVLPRHVVERLSQRVPHFEQEFWATIKATLDQAIKESDHGMAMERQDKAFVSRELALREAQEKNAHYLGSRGLNYGFVLAGGLVAGAVVTGIAGATTVAVALVGASALGMVSGFIQAGQQRRDARRALAAPVARKALAGPGSQSAKEGPS